MKKKTFKIEYLALVAVVIFVLGISSLSLVSIRQLQGNARVVNYVGIVRGATQKLVKKELQGHPDDALIEQLDSIVTELRTGEGSNSLTVLPDAAYLDLMAQVQAHWDVLRQQIYDVRSGGNPLILYNSSEDYFELVNRTVFAAEDFSERQLNRSTTLLWIVSLLFVAMLAAGLVYFLRSLSLKRRADTLGRIAYIDPLTQLPNRASCEQLMEKYTLEPPEEDVTVFMLDMNNLKRVNDLVGHFGGDRLIADFARILKAECLRFGFVARYGGDEFLAIAVGNEIIADDFLACVEAGTQAYNRLHPGQLDRISFAAGHARGNLGTVRLQGLVEEADRRMYEQKRMMKGRE